MAEGMIAAGCEMAGYWTKGEPQPPAGFIKRFPDAPRLTELALKAQQQAVKRGNLVR